MDKTTFKCEMNNVNQLKYHHSDKVRWLDVSIDYDMIKKYFILFDADIESREQNSMYFGIYVHDYSGIEPTKGKLCAWVENDEILSFGGVEFISTTEWEVCAGSTHPNHLNKGYSKAVCSFILKYILENGKKAICETNINNKASQRVLQEVGMIRV